MNEKNQIVNTLLYVSEEGAVSIDVIIDQEKETMWATQKTIAELFGVTKQNISYHLKDIFDSEELHQNSVVKKNFDNCTRWKKIQNQFL